MTNLPKHIAFIVDGNRRWAKKKKFPEFSGHKYVVEAVIGQLVEQAIKLNIPYLTFWVLSTENWKRGKVWIKKYFNLLSYYFKNKLQDLLEKGVRIKIIGNVKKLPVNIQKILKTAQEKSKNFKKITVLIAINYGGRDEIVRAVNKIVINPVFQQSLRLALRGQETNRVFIAKEHFSKHLDTAGIPDPDLIIRTGGSQRLSGFMLWQSEYSELYFTNTLMPDFTLKEFAKALEEYRKRKRNFGK